MDSRLVDRENELEVAKVENQIAEQRSEAAQRKAIEQEARRRYGKDWKKILGIRVKQDVVQSMYSVDPDFLRGLAKPRR